MSSLSVSRQETIHRVSRPDHFFKLIQAGDGSYLHCDEHLKLTLSTETSDDVIWDVAEGNELRHVKTNFRIKATPIENTNQVVLKATTSQPCEIPNQPFEISHGPAHLPSAYLEELRQNGWTCLTQVIDDATLEGLEKVACTDRYEGQVADRSQPAMCQSAAVARTIAEPISLWVIREYLQIQDVRLSHTPGFAVLRQDDGKRNVQGWHSDFPYHWGVPAKGVVPTPTGKTSLGVQRNVCVSPFTREGGGTIFKLGSHALDRPPPDEWGTATAHAKPGYREENGLPYGGPNADVVDAPGGSIILYDSRTWHRAGVNNTTKKRSALLQAMTPMYILPKNDTSRSYKQFVGSSVFNEITQRERDEIRNLMVHHFIGPGGEYPITVDTDPVHSMESSRKGY